MGKLAGVACGGCGAGREATSGDDLGVQNKSALGDGRPRASPRSTDEATDASTSIELELCRPSAPPLGALCGELCGGRSSASMLCIVLDEPWVRTGSGGRLASQLGDLCVEPRRSLLAEPSVVSVLPKGSRGEVM